MNSLLAYIPFFGEHDNSLIVIFGFVIIVIAIQAIARWQRDRLWHETARAAIEKGQPVPPLDDPRAWRKYRRCGRRGLLPRGIVTIAVALGLYFISPDGLGRWWILPLCIGLAQLVCWGVATAIGDRGDRPDRYDDVQNPPR